jgi:hypothetical protein
MLKPTVGELLSGIVASLRETVLPSVTNGAAKRQLKAALHALGRLEKSWDQWPACIAADNADMLETLERSLGDLVDSSATVLPALTALELRVKAIKPNPLARVRGVNDPSLAAAADLNDRLQGLVADFSAWIESPDHAAPAVCVQRAGLAALYQRMVERELLAFAGKLDED